MLRSANRSAFYFVKTILTVLLMSLRIIWAPKNEPLFEQGKVLVRKTSEIDVFGSSWFSMTTLDIPSPFRFHFGYHMLLLRLSGVASKALR